MAIWRFKIKCLSKMFCCTAMPQEVFILQVNLKVSLSLFYSLSPSLEACIFQTVYNISHSTCSSFNATLTLLPLKRGLYASSLSHGWYCVMLCDLQSQVIKAIQILPGLCICLPLEPSHHALRVPKLPHIGRPQGEYTYTFSDWQSSWGPSINF